jgi:protein TonB
VKRERKEKHFIKKPDYPGGDKGMSAFIRENLRYPEEALKNRTEGIVRIRITIDHKGTVTQTHIIDHLGNGCDEEADRVVRLLQFRVPNNRGVRASFHKTLNIHFQLPPSMRPIGGMQYQYVQKGKKEESEEKKSSVSGGYSIKLTRPGV